MSMFCLLSRCALYQVVGEAADRIVPVLNDRVSDQSRLLIDALQEAGAKAWKSVEIALAGESLWNKLDAADEKAFRQQIRNLLDNMQLPLLTARKEFGRLCLSELQQAKKEGLLLPKTTPDELAKSLGGFARHGDQSAVLAQQNVAVQEMSALLDKARYKNLAWLIAQEVNAGQGLLMVATHYFFRKQVTSNEKLSRLLQFSGMQTLTQNQESGFKHLDELMQSHGSRMDGLLDVAVETRDRVKDMQSELAEVKAMLVALAAQAELKQRQEVRPGDSRSIRGPRERQRVQEAVTRYEALPEDARRRQPDMLQTVALLQFGVGESAAAQQNFDRLAHLAADPKARAQALYNSYTVALERRDFTAALRCLCEAVELDPERHAPFPFADYEPQRILGAGGFGVAFLCQHTVLQRARVVKSLRLDGLDRDAGDVFREATALNDLEHPGIIRLRECRYADAARTRAYIVMDYFESMPLSEYVRRHGTLQAHEMLPVGLLVAEALQAAHAQGILHRDVKPDNLLVNKEASGAWKVKLIDFGLAVKQETAEGTVRSPETPSGPQEMVIAGTVNYAAPEQMGELPGVKVGTHSDVYGFGKLCYFALLGTPGPDDFEKDSLDERWRRLLSQCTARKIEGRIKDFGTVLERLREVEANPATSKPTPRPVVKPTPKPVVQEPTPAIPTLEIVPSPPPKPAPAKPKSTVPPRYISESTDKPTKTSQPTLGGLWGGTESNAAEPAPESEPSATPASEPPPSNPKKPKKGPLGGAFGG